MGPPGQKDASVNCVPEVLVRMKLFPFPTSRGGDGLEYDFSPERGYNDSPSCLRLRSEGEEDGDEIEGEEDGDEREKEEDGDEREGDRDEKEEYGDERDGDGDEREEEDYVRVISVQNDIFSLGK
uniref:Uncharacterized protein n=1 Tax=Rhodnius prolixus TaxID=13249 RepID=T1IEW8_RHOPR